MKQADKDGLYRGDILEGMMTGQKPLEFIPLNELSNERSGGRVVSWITSWCKDNTGTVWGGNTLKKMEPENWFELHTQDMPRIWTPPPEAMENMVEVFNKYSLTHPHILHVFAIQPGFFNESIFPLHATIYLL